MYLKSQAESCQSSFKMVGVVDEKRFIPDGLFSFEFAKKQQRSLGISGGKQHSVEDLTGIGGRTVANSQRQSSVR